MTVNAWTDEEKERAMKVAYKSMLSSSRVPSAYCSGVAPEEEKAEEKRIREYRHKEGRESLLSLD